MGFVKVDSNHLLRMILICRKHFGGGPSWIVRDCSQFDNDGVTLLLWLDNLDMVHTTPDFFILESSIPSLGLSTNRLGNFRYAKFMMQKQNSFGSSYWCDPSKLSIFKYM